ncbi:MAG TPA: hypothetical protein VJ302_34520, partial [Blastocatellia bacterium]|nr:hypothetical protein [Blastocatellia bacterium]
LELDEEGKSREVTPTAIRLIQHFHLLARGVKSYQPRPRGTEIKHAETVVRRLGAEGAWFFIEYALSEAKKTRFKMAQFGGTMQYLDAAEAAWRQRHEDQKHVFQREMEELASQKEEEQLIHETEERIRTLRPEAFKALYAKGREEIIRKTPAAATWDEETIEGPIMALIREQMLAEIPKPNRS